MFLSQAHAIQQNIFAENGKISDKRGKLTPILGLEQHNLHKNGYHFEAADLLVFSYLNIGRTKHHG